MTRTPNYSRKASLLVPILSLCLATTACNTVKGLGEDIKSVGEAGEEAIN